MQIGSDDISAHLQQLDMQVESTAAGWLVTPPSYRFDIAIEEDLIEELARMVGYDQIPVIPGAGQVSLARANEGKVSPEAVTDLMVARGFNEVVTFSFIEGDEQTRITGAAEAIPLANPISRDLNVLRSSLWPGLLRCAAFNLSRQVERCRLFEVGTVFAPAAEGVAESTCVAGLIVGAARPPHWEGAAAEADFFDLKADVEALLSMWNADAELRFEAQSSAGLNPARAAVIVRGERQVGCIGELHPALQNLYEFRAPVLLFEIDLLQLGDAAIPKFEAFSKFPSTRRDLAVIVDEAVTVAELTEHVVTELGSALRRCEIFDIYRGPGVDSGRKSVGMGLILQDASRTLNDEETDDMMRRVMRHLEQKLEATIRN
jgi:phenylalanyl-tRNA synthetase beta chain